MNGSETSGGKFGGNVFRIELRNYRGINTAINSFFATMRNVFRVLKFVMLFWFISLGRRRHLLPY